MTHIKVIKTTNNNINLKKIIKKTVNNTHKTQNDQMEKINDQLGYSGMSLIEPHQPTGIAWMIEREKRGLGGLQCDDMGLGKTLQTCSMMFANPLPLSLIICPPILISQWKTTLELFNKNNEKPTKIIILESGETEKICKEVLEENTRHLIIISSPLKMIKRGQDSITPTINMIWNRVIIDEAHIIRNKKSKIYQTICNITSDIYWALTGTPFNNGIQDVHSILYFTKCIHKQSLSLNNIQDAYKKNSIRRIKEKCLQKPIPKYSVYNIKIQFQSQKEIDLYTQIEDQVFGQLNIHGFEGIEMTMELFEKLIRLRQSVSCPQAVLKSLNCKYFKTNPSPSWDKTPTPLFPMYLKSPFTQSVGNCSKINFVVSTTVREQEKNHTHIIFTQFNHEIYTYNKIFSSLGYKIGMINGKTSRKNKKQIVNNFSFNKYIVMSTLSQKLNMDKHSYEINSLTNKIFKIHSYDILLIQITSGGMGLNLQAATSIIITSPHYNPTMEMQAICRSYRVGQDYPITIKRVSMAYPNDIRGTICNKTIDQHIWEIQDNKVDKMIETLDDSSFNMLM